MGTEGEEEGIHNHMVYRRKGTHIRQWHQTLRHTCMPNGEITHHQRRQEYATQQKI